MYRCSKRAKKNSRPLFQAAFSGGEYVVWITGFVSVLGLGGIVPTKIAIPLHKLFTLGQIIGSVVGGADFVVFNMGKLSLYRVRVEALLIQNAACRRTETVRGYSAFVAYALNDSADGCITDKAVGFGTARKQKRRIACDFFQFCQKFKRPVSQRNGMGRLPTAPTLSCWPPAVLSAMRWRDGSRALWCVRWTWRPCLRQAV